MSDKFIIACVLLFGISLIIEAGMLIYKIDKCVNQLFGLINLAQLVIKDTKNVRALSSRNCFLWTIPFSCNIIWMWYCNFICFSNIRIRCWINSSYP